MTDIFVKLLEICVKLLEIYVPEICVCIKLLMRKITRDIWIKYV